MKRRISRLADQWSNRLLTDSKKSCPLPLRLLLAAIILILVVEVIMTTVLQYLKLNDPLVGIILDSLFLVFLLFPALYYFLLRPFLNETGKRGRSRED